MKTKKIKRGPARTGRSFAIMPCTMESASGFARSTFRTKQPVAPVRQIFTAK
jgi:hypothetical protein